MPRPVMGQGSSVNGIFSYTGNSGPLVISGTIRNFAYGKVVVQTGNNSTYINGTRNTIRGNQYSKHPLEVKVKFNPKDLIEAQK